MLTGALRSMTVPNARSDPRFRSMAATHDLGIGAYSGVPLRHVDGRLYGTLCVLHPSRREVERGEVALLTLAARLLMHVIDARELARSEERYRALVETSPDAIGAISPEGVVLMANRAAADLLGFDTIEELVGANMGDLIAPEDRGRAFTVLGQRVAGAVSATTRVGYTILRRDGTRLAAEVSTSDLRSVGRSIEGFLLVIHDVTERKAFEETLRHQALHDPLTGLPNRSLLRDRLQQAILAADAEKTHLALLFSDVDGFKEINDTFGHHVGDALLEKLATRLTGAVRDIDTVARLGGDEFAILLPGVQAAEAIRLADRLRIAASRPYDAAGHQIDVDLSVGIAMYPKHGRDPSILMRRADMAMYASKRSGSGRGCTMFHSDQEVSKPSRLSLIRALRQAIESDQLVLHYQPQADLRTGTVVGVEALVRWPRGERGLIPPAEFIPLAEETGLIGPLTLSVLRQALLQSRSWHDSGIEVRVAVNLSPSTLQDTAMLKALTRLIHSSHTPPSCLEIEITESALLVDPTSAREFLGHLHGMGVRIAIDDFGMGHSSLTLVRQLPIDSIKIDKSFILRVTENQDDAFIAESIVNLGHHLGLAVTAEGIENVGAWDHLADLGCDVAQGYFLAPPMPAQDFPSWLSVRDFRVV